MTEEITLKGSQQQKPPVREWTDELQQDYDRIFAVGEECITGDELKRLLLSKGRGSESPGFVLYDGFEPSGRMHIAQGVFKAMNVNKCTFPGTNSTFVFWVADWFALMNDKMGGDLDKIQTVGHYLQEVWKAAGMDLTHVVFKWASEEITQHADTYWPTMLDVARRFNITRIKKCCQIMGRLEGSLTAAQVLYPLMQCTDVFFLKADICQLGVDQRKVNMLAREYCDAAGRKFKPIILSHHMLYGLKAGQEKMSKSDPDSAIFMEDTAADVERKIRAAYCPSQELSPTDDTDVSDAARSSQIADNEDAGKASLQLKVDHLKNPCLDYIQNIIFSPPGATFVAGTKSFSDFDSVRAAFLAGEITEEQLKSGLIDELNRLLDPVREHFTNDPRAKDLLQKVQQYKKESMIPAAATVRRLDLVKAQMVPAASHLVFAPLPNANPTLQEAVDVLSQLRQHSDLHEPTVLYLPDWTARVCNACASDVKVIDSYFTVLITALRSLDRSLMNRVTVIRQSDAILKDPSNYWISVINVGRHFMLDAVMGPHMKDSECVGAVIGRLMRVADVAGVEPRSVCLTDEVEKALLESDFFPSKLPGITVPHVALMRSNPIRLQPERETEALKTENDEFFLLDDPKVHGKAKMKKAFCEPGNIGFCPPIALTSALCFGAGTDNCLIVKRAPDNGGDVKFETVADLEKDFANMILHPGDLKSAVADVVINILDKLAADIKADASATKSSKDLKAFQKKLDKLKK